MGVFALPPVLSSRCPPALSNNLTPENVPDVISDHDVQAQYRMQILQTTIMQCYGVGSMRVVSVRGGFKL